MDVTVARSGKKIRVPRALRIFGQDRQTMDEAFPGDIIGVICPGDFNWAIRSAKVHRFTTRLCRSFRLSTLR